MRVEYLRTQGTLLYGIKSSTEFNGLSVFERVSLQGEGGISENPGDTAE